MDRPGRCAHRSYLADYIRISILPKKVDPSEIRRLYLEKNLSASQIGERLGVSKQMILARLRSSGIHRTVRKGRSPDNYRYPEPPFGQKILAGRLVLNSREMKIVRLIIQMRDQKRWPWVQIVEHLEKENLRTRRGKHWSRVGVKRVYRRWSGKV